MNLVRWQPRMLAPRGLNGIDQELERLFDWAIQGDANCGRQMMPALDVAEEENRYVVRADVPGLTKDEIDITYQDGVLTLKGERKREALPENGRSFLRERFEGKFGRNLRLPQNVDPSRIEARLKDGTLELVLPFTPEAQPRKIQVNG